MDYKPADNIWKVKPNLRFDQPLAVEDPRYVDTEKGRGDFSYNQIFLTVTDFGVRHM
jgi:hypothetical protein